MDRATRARVEDHDPSPPSAAQLSQWGLDPTWSRLVSFVGANEELITWHVLDTGPGSSGTIVCVHGNPTWGYYWRDLLETLSPAWRVIAVDQTSMGYSQRSSPRRLAERIDELVTFISQEVTGPVVLAAHDWGGPVAVGASAALEVEALILANTAVAKPDDVKVPPLIALARRLVTFVCETTPIFVEGTARMTRKEHRSALRAPYASASRRAAIGQFVADIPVTPSDPSWAALDRSARALRSLDCPVLVLWGGRDPVFHDRFRRDLVRRVPGADVERFADAGHLVCLDEPVGLIVDEWLTTMLPGQYGEPGPREASISLSDANAASFDAVSLLSALEERVGDTGALYEGPDGILTWEALAERSSIGAAVLVSAGLVPGDRVSLLVPPSADLLVASCAIWRAGGVPVVADAAQGLLGLRRLIRAATPSFVLGTRATLAMSSLLRVAPGATVISTERIPGVRFLFDEVADLVIPLRTERPDALAAIVHTSGATGPAKPVRYAFGALCSLKAIIEQMLSLESGESFTTSFGPFLLLAPVLGVSCVRPDIDVSSPSELDFDRMTRASSGSPVAVAWLSPASARTIVATANGRTLPLRLVLLAGAPISAALVRSMALVTGGEVRTPYGMTECLPVTDGCDPLAVGPSGGTSTGRPLPGCEVRVVTYGADQAREEPEGSWGALVVRAPWMFDGYDHRWGADYASRVEVDGELFHVTGDVGYLSEGRLFQLGRAVDVMATAESLVPSGLVEAPLEELFERAVAAVGIGPIGAQVICVIVDAPGRLRLADDDLAMRVRRSSSWRIAVVLAGSLPTDVRHQSKIDRNVLRREAQRFVSGR